MTKLFPEQQAVANKIIDRLNNKNHISNQKIIISGEMGSGKTYIASYVINALKNNGKTLIISPSNVREKWKTVFQKFSNSPSIEVIYPRKKDFDPKKIENTKTIIVSDKDLNKFFELTKQSLLDRQTQELKFNFENIIIDEIHMYRPTTKAFNALKQKYSTTFKNKNTLLLTGTPFNTNKSLLISFLEMIYGYWIMRSLNDRNISYSKEYGKDDLRYFDMVSFINHIWKYLAIPININTVSNLKKQDNEFINQEIAPLKGLELSKEELYFTQIKEYQLERIDARSKAIEKIITYDLDLPEKQDLIKSKTKKIRNDNPLLLHSNVNDGQKLTFDYYSGFLLKKIPITDTKKYKELINLLNKNPNKKTILFVQDKRLIAYLKKYLTKDGFSCDVLPTTVKNTKYQEYINNSLKNNDVFIIESKKITVGIDITKANQIIWYQCPTNISDIIQANRRVYRLNSTESSIVHFLYYKGTSQEKIIREVSESAKNNALVYNVRDTSNLSKVTEVLFSNIV